MAYCEFLFLMHLIEVTFVPLFQPLLHFRRIRGIDTRRNRRANRAQSNNQNETTARPNVPNPYPQAAEQTRSNPPRTSQHLPIAEMRSNDAPQDDQMPVGNVVGLASNQERRTEDPGNAARDETI
jgi:hypothetical protein